MYVHMHVYACLPGSLRSLFSRKRSAKVGGFVGRLSEIFSNAENLSGVCPEIFENSFDDEGDERERRERGWRDGGALGGRLQNFSHLN